MPYEVFKSETPGQRPAPEARSQKGGQDRSVDLTSARPGVR